MRLSPDPFPSVEGGVRQRQTYNMIIAHARVRRAMAHIDRFCTCTVLIQQSSAVLFDIDHGVIFESLKHFQIKYIVNWSMQLFTVLLLALYLGWVSQ